MLADYFARSAVAAAQVLDGFDADRFRSHLEQTSVGIATPALRGEAAALADMAIRLLARLYPRLAIDGPAASRTHLIALARSINPNIDIVDEAELGIVVGAARHRFAEPSYAGSDGWHALLGVSGPLPVGRSRNPFGAGAAAALASAGLFRRVFLTDWTAHRDDRVVFDTFIGQVLRHRPASPGRAAAGPELPARLPHEAVLVGAGAIGHGAAWALRRLPTRGVIHLVDHETIELSNLQRYVLATRSDVDRVKVQLLAAGSRPLRLAPFHGRAAEFLSTRGNHWEAMLLALDSAGDRVSAQASLPAWIANAWTQPGDLGISSHSQFGGAGACVSCLYLPTGAVPNEDELVAQALGIPQMLMQVRTLLYTGAGVDDGMLAAIAQAIGRPPEVLAPFRGRTLRELYVDGFCGGAVIPLGQSGAPLAQARDLHVPLAHQSALAGVLLAAALIRHALQGPPAATTITRINVLRPLADEITQPALAAGTDRCICEDADFRDVYANKYPAPTPAPAA